MNLGTYMSRWPWGGKAAHGNRVGSQAQCWGGLRSRLMSPVTFSCRRPEEALLRSNHGVQPWGPRHCGPGRGPVQNGAYGQTCMTSILYPQGLQHSSEHWEPWGDSCCPGRGWAQVVQRQPTSVTCMSRCGDPGDSGCLITVSCCHVDPVCSPWFGGYLWP